MTKVLCRFTTSCAIVHCGMTINLIITAYSIQYNTHNIQQSSDHVFESVIMWTKENNSCRMWPRKFVETITATSAVTMKLPGWTHHERLQLDVDSDYEKSLCCLRNAATGDSLAERFCLDSSLHGLKYIGQPRRTGCEKSDLKIPLHYNLQRRVPLNLRHVVNMLTYGILNKLCLNSKVLLAWSVHTLHHRLRDDYCSFVEQILE